MSVRKRRCCCPLPLKKRAAHHILSSLAHPTCITERKMVTLAPAVPTWRRRWRWSARLPCCNRICVWCGGKAALRFIRPLRSPRSLRETTQVEQEVTHRRTKGMFSSHIVELLEWAKQVFIGGYVPTFESQREENSLIIFSTYYVYFSEVKPHGCC